MPGSKDYIETEQRTDVNELFHIGPFCTAELRVLKLHSPGGYFTQDCWKASYYCVKDRLTIMQK